MKLERVERKNVLDRPKEAFTLAETIGLLAVIFLLAALLIPKVFNALNDARINSVCINCEAIRTAVSDHFGKYGRLDYQFGTNRLTMPINGYDTNVLMFEGLLDRPFVARIAGGDLPACSMIQCVAGSAANAHKGYFLDGGTTNATANAGGVVEAKLLLVTSADAKDLNDRIDGPALGAPLGQADAKGRVEYAAPSAGTTTVYVYFSHR